MLKRVLTLILATGMMLPSAAAGQSGPPPPTWDRPKPPKRPQLDGAQACNPVGYNRGIGAYPLCRFDTGSAASPATPPRCSKTVSDHCVQAYERGVRR